jgi:L-rhamnose mutarotase
MVEHHDANAKPLDSRNEREWWADMEEVFHSD